MSGSPECGGEAGAGGAASPVQTRRWRPRFRARGGPVAAVLAVLLLAGVLWSRTTPPPIEAFDQHFYLGIAQDLRATGTYTDGFAFDSQPDGARPPGMRMAPLYPALLAGLADVDGGLARAMACDVATRNQDACPRSAPLARTLQFAMLTAVLWLVWAMAAALGGRGLAWLSLGLAAITLPLLLRSVDYLMTEMLTLLWTTAATAAGLRAVQRRSAGWAAASGAALALAALTRPAFLYLVPAAALVALWRAWRTRRLLPPGAPWPWFFAGAILPLLPWINRNDAVLGRPALTFGYDSHTLVQRIAFDTMTWREYADAYLCWLPDGTSLGRRFLGAGGCDRFGWDDHPTSFYTLGIRHLLPETLAAAGGWPHHLHYLLTHYVLAMPLWHAAVSVPLALRGAYVAHWWGFALLPVAVLCTVAAGRLGAPAFRVIALPAWFMLLFNASVAVNQVRYNLMLIPPYSVAGALLLRSWQRRAG